MHHLPILLNPRNKRCLIVGGGQVALRRARALLEADAKVVVVAPEIVPDLKEFAVEWHERGYLHDDMNDVYLVVIATSDPAVNDAAHHDARAVGALVNRTDDPDSGDFTVPAHAHHGPVTIAVSAGGISSSAAAAIRRSLSDTLDSDWATLLQCASEYRDRIKTRTSDPIDRRRKLRRLADERAMAILKERGETGLRAYYESL